VDWKLKLIYDRGRLKITCNAETEKRKSLDDVESVKSLHKFTVILKLVSRLEHEG
jgi:hypothetical protein